MQRPDFQGSAIIRVRNVYVRYTKCNTCLWVLHYFAEVEPPRIAGSLRIVVCQPVMGGHVESRCDATPQVFAVRLDACNISYEMGTVALRIILDQHLAGSA